MEWEVYFNKYKNRVLSIGIIVFALIIANNIYKVQNKAIILLKESRVKELKKNTILGDISVLDKKVKSYKNFLNKKDISLVIDNIVNIAKDSNVKIVSVRPEPGQVFHLYVKYTFNLTVNISDYLTLGKFINKLENSYDVYMVEGLNVRPRFETTEESAIRGLLVNLKVSTFLFKE